MSIDTKCESWLDALRDDIKALGGVKTVGSVLWPEKDPDAAGKLLAEMLNENRRHRLNSAQERLIIRMAREQRGFSSAMNYFCDQTGFEYPRALDPHDEYARLIREASRLEEERAQLIERAENLRQQKSTSTKLHSVK